MSMFDNGATRDVKLRVIGEVSGQNAFRDLSKQFTSMSKLADDQVTRAKANAAAQQRILAQQQAAFEKFQQAQTGAFDSYGKQRQVIAERTEKQITALQDQQSRARVRLEQLEAAGRVNARTNLLLQMEQREQKITDIQAAASRERTRIAADEAAKQTAIVAQQARMQQAIYLQQGNVAGVTSAAGRAQVMSAASGALGFGSTALIGIGGIGLGGGLITARSAANAQHYLFQQGANSMLSGTLQPSGSFNGQLGQLQRMSFGWGKNTGANWQDIVMAGRYGSDYGLPWNLNQQTIQAAIKMGLPTGGSSAIPGDLSAIATGLVDFPGYKNMPNGPMTVANMILAAARAGRADPTQFASSASRLMMVTGGFLGKNGVANPQLLPETLSLVAAITRANGGNIDDATMRVMNLIPHIVAPSSSQRKELKMLYDQTGIDLRGDFSATALNDKGITGILSDLHNANLSPSAMKYLLPDIRGYVGALNLTGPNFGQQGYMGVLKNVNGAAQSNSINSMFKNFLGLPSTQYDKVVEQLKQMAIVVGTEDLPAFTKMLAATTPLVKGTADFVSNNKNLIASFAQLAPYLLAAGLGIKGLTGYWRLANAAGEGAEKVIGGLVDWLGPNKLGQAVDAAGAAIGPNGLTRDMEGAKAGAQDMGVAIAGSSGEGGVAAALSTTEANANKARDAIAGSNGLTTAMTTAKGEAATMIGVETEGSVAADGSLVVTAVGSGLLGIAGAAALAALAIGATILIAKKLGTANMPSVGVGPTAGQAQGHWQQVPGPHGTNRVVWVPDPTQVFKNSGSMSWSQMGAALQTGSGPMPNGWQPNGFTWGLGPVTHRNGPLGLFTTGIPNAGVHEDYPVSYKPFSLPGGSGAHYLLIRKDVKPWGDEEVWAIAGPNNKAIPGTEFIFEHMSKMPNDDKLKAGQVYTGGTSLGISGNTGSTVINPATGQPYSDAPHLHFAAQSGALPYLYAAQSGKGWIQTNGAGAGGGNGIPSGVPQRIARWWPQITKASQATGVPPYVIASYMDGESSGNPNAWGPQTKYGRAYGLMQLMDNSITGLPTSINRFNVDQNVLGGAMLIKGGMKKYGNDFSAIYANVYNPGVSSGNSAFQLIQSDLSSWAPASGAGGSSNNQVNIKQPQAAGTNPYSGTASSLGSILTGSFGNGDLSNLKGPARGQATDVIDRIDWYQAASDVWDIWNNKALTPAEKQALIKQRWAKYRVDTKNPLATYKKSKSITSSPAYKKLEGRIGYDSTMVSNIDQMWTGIDPTRLPATGNGGINQQSWLKAQYKRDQYEADQKDARAKELLMLKKINDAQYTQLVKADNVAKNQANQDARNRLQGSGGYVNHPVPVHIIGRCKAEADANMHRKKTADHSKKTADHAKNTDDHTKRIADLMEQLVPLMVQATATTGGGSTTMPRRGGGRIAPLPGQ